MARKYHSLLIRDGGVWSLQFGDYSLAVVKQEARDAYSDHKARMIITTDDDQASIELGIEEVRRNG